MNLFTIVSLILLGLVLLDAIGDGFRWIGKQVAHHIVEAIRELIWVSLVAYFMGNYWVILMYFVARIIFFDPIINLVAGKGLDYTGSSSIYDRALKWFTKLPFIKEPGILIWWLRAMFFVFWVVWAFLKFR